MFLPFISWVDSSFETYFIRLLRGNYARVLVICSDGQLILAAFCLLSFLHFTLLIYQFGFLGLPSAKHHLYPNISDLFQQNLVLDAVLKIVLNAQDKIALL